MLKMLLRFMDAPFQVRLRCVLNGWSARRTWHREHHRSRGEGPALGVHRLDPHLVLPARQADEDMEVSTSVSWMLGSRWRARRVPSAAPCLRAQRPQSDAQLFHDELRLLPRREMPAIVELVVVNEFGIGTLCPTTRSCVEFVREGAYGNRDGDAFNSEKRELVLPVESTRGNPSVRQPRERDVIEEIVPREACGLPVKGARDELQATCVVVHKIGRQANGRICNPVKRLRTQSHLVCVADALRIYKFQLLVRESLVS